MRSCADARRVDARAGQPAYQQIEQWLMPCSRPAGCRAGDTLPQEADLAAALGVSRMTLRQALGALEALGRRRAHSRPQRRHVHRRAAPSSATSPGSPASPSSCGAVRCGRVRASQGDSGRAAPPRSRGALDIGRWSSVYEIVRVRRARGHPLALERSYLPAELFPGLLDKRLTGSLYARMAREYDSPRRRPRSTSSRTWPTRRSPGAASGAGRLRAAAHRAHRVRRGEAGPIEYASDLFRPDRIRVSIRTFAAATRYLGESTLL